jgi:site-specific DNA-methyltransferase (adenine-specific)
MPFEMPTSERPAVVIQGDCLERLRDLDDASVHVVLTDPPAGIGFMGSSWDSFRRYVSRTAAGRVAELQLGSADLLRRCRAALASVEQSHEIEVLVRDLDECLGADAAMPAWARGFVVFLVDVWSECKRVLKPGGWLCAWGLPRTTDLLGLSLRLAGFDLKEVGLHLFGGGKPAGLDLGVALKRKGISAADRLRGCHTQLRPGHEHWLVARRPFERDATATSTAAEHSTAAFNIAACRVPRTARPLRERAETAATGIYGEFAQRGSAAVGETDEGSFTSDVLLTHAAGCSSDRCVVGCPVKEIDVQSGVRTNGIGSKRKASAGGARGHVYGKCTEPVDSPQKCIGDTGGASRYFHSFRAARAGGTARLLACSRVRLRTHIIYLGKRPGRRVPGAMKNDHPTVKTQALMRLLVRLLATRGGGERLVVLDPFAGSGSTAEACIAEGVLSISIELDEKNVATALSRVAASLGDVERARLANAIEGSATTATLGQLLLC